MQHSIEFAVIRPHGHVHAVLSMADDKYSDVSLRTCPRFWGASRTESCPCRRTQVLGLVFGLEI